MAPGQTDATAAPGTPSTAPIEPDHDARAGDGAVAPRGWRDRLTRPGPGAGVAMTLLPFAVGVVVLVLVVGGDYHPVHDLAQIELRIRDVGHHEVLLGPYSREGWYHPGPAMFFLLAVPYRLLGGASVGMDVGALVVNGAAVAGMALVARRRGGTPLFLVTLVACSLLIRSLGPDLLRDPWNPSLPVLAFGLVLFLSWTMTCGDVWALPVAAGVASFVVQTHIGYLALAVPLVAWGAGWLVALAVRRPDLVPRRRLARAGLVTGAVTAVLWAPPVVQQLTTEPGNMGEAFEYFRATDEAGHTLGDALRVLAAQLTATPEWIAGNAPLTLSGEPTALYGSAPIPVLLLPLAVAAVVLWRRGSSDARRLLLTLGLASVLGLLAIVNTTGLAFAYRLRWVEVLAMTAGIVVLWAAWLWCDTLLRRSADDAGAPAAGRADTIRRRVGVAAAAAIVVLAATSTVAQVRAGTPQEHDSAAVAELLPEVEAALPAGDDPVLVRPSSFGSMLYVPALLLGLEREGTPAVVDPISAAVGEHRLYRPGEPLRAQLVVAVDEEVTPRLDDPTLDLVAAWGDPPEPEAADPDDPDPDDPVKAFEAAFPTGDIERLEALARATLDESGDLEAPYTVEAVAVFSLRPGRATGAPPPAPAADAPAG